MSPQTDRRNQLSAASRVIGTDEADGALLARYRKGDQQAFAELVVRYQRPLYNAALWIVRKPEDASDVTQIVFLRVAERLDSGNVVCLFADGGWKYLSTQLWTTDYDDLPEDIEDKIWW